MADPFQRREGELFVEDMPLAQIAQQYGTPCYVYSRAAITTHFMEYRNALEGQPNLVCYAVKANSNIALLKILADLGAGFDIVSGGELERVIRAGGSPDRIVFSGVAKSLGEMRRALELGIHCFNVESESELESLNELAGDMGLRAPVSLRVNPDVDANTHPYISTGLRENKFGISMESALEAYNRAAELPHLDVLGLDCHIGSQLTEIAPFIDALHRLLALMDALKEEGIALTHLDLGGGLGVRYRDEQPPAIGEYIAAVRKELAGRELTLMFEPGRSIVGTAGALLTRVEYLKPGAVNNFALVDAAMNDMLRPALYQAWLDITPVQANNKQPLQRWDVVGPVCETGDFLGKERMLAVQEGDLLAVLGAGAYGFTMSSNYNSRPRPPEIIVDGTTSHLVRQRETLDDLLRGEQLLPDHQHG